MNLANNNEIANILSKIPSVISDNVEGKFDGLFIYAEFEPGVISWGIYNDIGDKVIYVNEPNGFTDILQEAWKKEKPEKRWSALFYTMKDQKFNVRFLYAGDWDEDEFYHDRVSRILKEKYGDKPIEYPKLGQGSGWIL